MGPAGSAKVGCRVLFHDTGCLTDTCECLYVVPVPCCADSLTKSVGDGAEDEIFIHHVWRTYCVSRNSYRRVLVFVRVEYLAKKMVRHQIVIVLSSRRRVTTMKPSVLVVSLVVHRHLPLSYT